MNKDGLNRILKNHKKWFYDEGGKRADLTGADLIGADLTGADLIGADLRGADLREADLRGADLREANLTGADLREANLTGADLREANLSVADLREANLNGANLNYCRGNNKEVKSLHIGTWDIVYTNEIISIGCVQKSISELFNMSDEDIDELATSALEWWTKWKDLLKQVMIKSGVLESAFESKGLGHDNN